MASYHGEPSEQGHEYGTTINHGTLHQGNTYNTYLVDEKPKVDCREALLLNDPFLHKEHLKREKGRRAPGTCEWIKENEAYKSWLNGDEQCLWICGGPGKGKTMLSIFLTEELESKHTQDTTVLFFFCISGDKNRNNATSILRGLSYQLLTRHPSLSEYISSYFETPKRAESTLSSWVALWIVFKTLLQAPESGTVFCVLDGLDECDEDSIDNLVRQFRDFYSQSEHTTQVTQYFKLVIVSRMLNGLDIFSQVRLDPDNDACISEDIIRLISTRTQELSRLPGFDQNFRSDVENTLLSHSEGTFLWIGFVMDELLRKTTCTEVIDSLNTIPRGLPAMYNRMLEQIESKKRRVVSPILTWVTVASRPMTLEELRTAISLLSDTLIPSSQTMHDHIAWCGPILRTSDGQVSLVHQSARDYLLREEADNGLRINPDEAHGSLARICLNYIEKSDFGNQSLDTKTSSVLQKWPLLHYAAMHWPEHARRSLYTDKDISLARPFFQKHSNVRNNWWKAYRDANHIQEYNYKLPLLHMVSYLGIGSLVRKLLRTNIWHFNLNKRVNEKDEGGVTALILAAQEGHTTVVDLLLRNGADVNHKDNDDRTALIQAAKGGHGAVVQLLLRNGADVNTKYAFGATALDKAAEEGHRVVAQLLLKNGADVNHKDNLGETALIKAVVGGHEALVQLLLENGADIGGDKLVVNAAIAGNEAIFQLLLKKGVNFQGTRVIGYAAERGHEVIVRLLIEIGAGSERAYSIALISAAMRGYEAIVHLLLKNGADANTKDKIGETPLIKAASRGYEAVVQLLLTNGAIVDMKNGRGNTALILAAGSGHKAIVHLLLKNGADISMKNNYGNTAIYRAAAGGHGTVIQLLLANGADIEVKNKFGDTSLYKAVLERHKGVIQLLLANGADANTYIQPRWAAEYKEEVKMVLSVAAQQGHEAITQVLLLHGDATRRRWLPSMARQGWEEWKSLYLDNNGV